MIYSSSLQHSKLSFHVKIAQWETCWYQSLERFFGKTTNLRTSPFKKYLQTKFTIYFTKWNVLFHKQNMTIFYDISSCYIKNRYKQGI